jgi:TolA-binding protein
MTFKTSSKDDEIQLIKKNAELKAQIDQLEGEINNNETKFNELRRTLSEKDRKNEDLEKQIDRLEKKISKQEDEVKSLQTKNRNKNRENDELRQQVDQLQEINTHPVIRDIAVKATGKDPVFGEHFRTLDIDINLPIELRRWLEELLIPVVDPLGNMGFGNLDLNQAINQYRDFDRADSLLAHVIRTQGNLSVHGNTHEMTKVGRALCCFFAAALLSPKLPEP